MEHADTPAYPREYKEGRDMMGTGEEPPADLHQLYDGPNITAEYIDTPDTENGVDRLADAEQPGAPATREDSARVRLYGLARANGVSMQDVARELGVADTVVYKFFNGDTTPVLSAVGAIARAITSDPAELAAISASYQAERAQVVGAANQARTETANASGDGELAHLPRGRAALIRSGRILAEHGIDMEAVVPPRASTLVRALPLLLNPDLTNADIAAQLGTTPAEISVLQHRIMQRVLQRVPPEITKTLPPLRGRRNSVSQEQDTSQPPKGTIGPKLDELCMEAGLSRREIEKALGSSQSMLSRFLSGRTMPPLPYLAGPLLQFLADKGVIKPTDIALYAEGYKAERQERYRAASNPHAGEAPQEVSQEAARALLLGSVAVEGAAVVEPGPLPPLTAAELGPRVRALIDARQISPRDLAVHLEVDLSTLYRFFAGVHNSDRKMVRDLLRKLEVDDVTERQVLDAYRNPRRPDQAGRPISSGAAKPERLLTVAWEPDQHRQVIHALYDAGIDIVALQPPDTAELPLRKAIRLLLDDRVSTDELAAELGVSSEAIPGLTALALHNVTRSGIDAGTVEWIRQPRGQVGHRLNGGQLEAVSSEARGATVEQVAQWEAGQVSEALGEARQLLQEAGIAPASLIPERAERLRGALPWLLNANLSVQQIGQQLGLPPANVRGMRRRALTYMMRNAPRDIANKLPRPERPIVHNGEV